MRLPQIEIPSSFIRLDTHVTEADSFVNVRDLQLARLNHNILVARRIRREVMHIVFNEDSSDTPFHYRCRSRVGQGTVTPVIWFGQVLISQWTAELELVVRACKSAIDGSSSFTGNPTLYAKLQRGMPSLPTNQNLVGATISAATGTPTKYSLTLPVPQESSRGAPWRGYEFYWLTIMGDTPIDTAYAKDQNRAISDVGERWVELSSVSLASIDYAIHHETDATFPVRQVIASDLIAAGTYRYWVDEPWGRSLDIGTDTMTLRRIQGIDLYSMSIYEKPVTDLESRDAPL